VAALEGIKTPSEVARLVLKYTDHILLVGEGAKKFALSYGFKEEDLLTPSSREKWLRWRANRGKDDWNDIPAAEQLFLGEHRPTGTINLNLINEKGELSSITTTSGLAFKIPGRAGDSPIVGAGTYADNAIGAAGSTGLGELNIMVCGGFLTVEGMRQGLSPVDACLATLKRVVAMCPADKRDAQGRPPQITYYAINKRGEYGAASMFPASYAACDDSNGARTLDAAHLYDKPSGAAPRPRGSTAARSRVPNPRAGARRPGRGQPLAGERLPLSHGRSHQRPAGDRTHPVRQGGGLRRPGAL
jgi:N4-(beta-N-acetylglucosaminyl)-L-asparaginase